MSNRQIVLVVAAVLLAGLASYSLFFSQAVTEYSFPARDGKSNLIYRCAQQDSPAETEKNARAAHDFFEPAVVKITEAQAVAMSQSMASGEPSSNVSNELENIQTDFKAQLDALQQETKARFGCSYRMG